jgi:hypothetical protein
MTFAPTSITSPQVSNYMGVQPLIAATKTAAGDLPKTSLPTEVPGTIQENAHNIPTVLTYNAHGILNTNNPNSLIAYA